MDIVAPKKRKKESEEKQEKLHCEPKKQRRKLISSLPSVEKDKKREEKRKKQTNTIMSKYEKDDDSYNEMRNDMLNEFIRGDDEPTRRDVGVFLTKEEVDNCCATLMEKIPAMHREGWDNIYGTDSGPHTFGTKIMMSKAGPQQTPLYATIVGLRTYGETYTYIEPYYIVFFKGQPYNSSYADKLPFFEVHEENWKTGWGDDMEEDYNEKELRELLGIKDDSENDEDEPFPDDYNGSSGTVYQETEKVYEKEIWNVAVNGSLGEVFWANTFTPEELQRYRKDRTISPDKKMNSSDLCTLEERMCLMNIILADTRDNKGGVILELYGEKERQTKFLAIEFDGHYLYNGEPIVAVKYGIAYEKEHAEAFLGGETIEVLSCSGRVMSVIQQQLLGSYAGTGLNDIGSGLLLFEGYLSPIQPMNEQMNNLIRPPAVVVPQQYSTLGLETFGVEVEVSCVINSWNSKVAHQIYQLAGVRVNNLMDRELRNPLYIMGILDIDDHRASSKDEWTIKRDGSLRGSADYSHSHTFEFVSRILTGEEGLVECHNVLDVLNNVAAIYLNHTMAMHVHIGVQKFTLCSLKKVCANFVLFEDVIDTFMSLSRRRNNKYCQSHTVELETHGSKQQIFELILASKSENDLFDLLNPGSKPRYHKLNLQNLKTKKRTTIEFRQHSATTNCQAVEAWVRFCMNFVYNSVDCVLPPVVFNAFQEEETRFDVLFDCLIQDPKLKLYYKVQREKLLLVTSLARRAPTTTKLLSGADGNSDNTAGKGGAAGSGSKKSRTFGFIDTRQEECVDTFCSFSGAGTTLGAASSGTTNGNSTSGDGSSGVFDPSSLPAAPTVGATTTCTTKGNADVSTSIAVRMLDGTRKIIQTRLDASIEELASLIVQVSNPTISIPFRIVSGFPPKPISSSSGTSNSNNADVDGDGSVSKVTTIRDCGLQGAQIQVQKVCDGNDVVKAATSLLYCY